MFKKFLSIIVMASFIVFMLPTSTIAADYPFDLVNSVSLSVPGGSTGSFNPSSESMNIDISFNTAQYSSQIAGSTGSILVKSGSTVVDTVLTWTSGNRPTSTVSWDGMCGTSACANGSYSVEVNVDYESVPGTHMVDTDTADFTVVNGTSLTVTSFTVSESEFDPAPDAGNETQTFTYSLSATADSVSVIVRDSDDKQVKTHSNTNVSTGSFGWDGTYANKLLDPGNYEATLTATISGQGAVTEKRSFIVDYDNSNKPGISSFEITPDSFDPDVEDTIISFENDEDSYITVKILKSDVTYRTFDDYEHDNYNSGDSHDISWDGDNNSGSQVSTGTYTVYVRAENDYGVVVVTDTVVVDNSGGTLSTSNSHIDSISFSPSSTFEPAEDDELEIEFDVEKDLDSLEIYAIRGSEEIELYDENDVEEENNVQIYWDGTDDDDDYVEKGAWRILFKSQLDGSTLQAARSIDVDYEEPRIDDFELSKDKFDNDLDEFTYILFRIDQDAIVDILVLEDGDEDDEIEEDYEVEKDRWYAVAWDGDNYDYDDDLDIKLVAKNKANEDVYDSEKISVDLREDDVSSTRSNVTNDYIDPVVSTGKSDFELHYELEEDAGVRITIHKGTSSSSTTIIELLDVDEQDAGDKTIIWNGLDDDGDRLSTGFYTYKIVSDLSSTDTETGLFVIGNVGDVEGSSSSDSDSDDSSISPNVTIRGEDGTTISGNCGGFSDVTSSSIYCNAIEWAESEGIFEGYSDGTFKPNQAINRVEVLKVILEGLNFSIYPDDGTTQGFSDVIQYAWYMKYIRTGVMYGIFEGDGGATTARPDATVNRAELLKMIFEALDSKGGYALSTCVSPYPDVESNIWYNKYACEADEYNLFDSSYLSAATLSTRGEVAEVLYRLHKEGVI